MTSESADPLTRQDIVDVLDRVEQLQESFSVVGSVGESLRRVNSTVGSLRSNLELAVQAQALTEELRRIDAAKNGRRFWFTIGGIVIANILAISISLAVLLGQIQARDLSDARSAANRDRQSCATSLLVEWDEKVGRFLRVTTQIPAVDRQSPEYQHALAELNAATELIGRAQELCYGPNPNPNPVPR